MIREIINFTKDLIEDLPEIVNLNNKPQDGLYVFIDINESGEWTNHDLRLGIDYAFFDGKNQDSPLLNECIRYQEATNYITMNKVKAFDSKQKIHSCSPFAVSYNFNFSSADQEALGIKKNKKRTEEEKVELARKIREKRKEVIKERLNDYRRNAYSIYKIDETREPELFSEKREELSDYIPQLNAFYDAFDIIIDKVSELDEYKKLTEKDYLKAFLRSVPIAIQEKLHDKYVEDNLLNGDEIDDKGVLGFLTSYSSKKVFVQHKTSPFIKGYSYRFSKSDALVMNTFEKIWKRKCLPNPLPIVIDKREINKEIIKIFNEESEPIPFRQMIRNLFEKTNEKTLTDYYLLYCRNSKDGMVLDDFDFIPLFRYRFDNTLIIENVTEAGLKSNGVFEKDNDERMDNVFDFERIVVRAIFNNSLVKIKGDDYKTNYFGDIDSKHVSGGDLMWQLIMKYRKAFYDYIYKSRTNAITSYMFDDMMFLSILTNIQDNKKTRYENNNTIKKKINIWFSLYNLFNNNKKETIMASNVTDLLSKMKSVTQGVSNIETPEEFAFGAGQLASYLIDRSAASNKTYAMLEPYLQKSKSGQLQDAIAQTIAVYKHDISVYKGNFEMLAAQVLTYDGNADMKPLHKFFLAGCFCHCIIYKGKNENNNQ